MTQESEKGSIYKSAAGRPAIMAWYEAKISNFSITTESLDVPTAAGQTHITITGSSDGPPLIVLHGGFMNGPSMENVIVPLSTNHRVYTIDIIGMPGKSAETRLSVKGDDYTTWLVEVMDQLKLHKTDFLALSFGGWHLLKLASLQPERIKRAVLLDPAGLIPIQGKGMAAIMWAILQCKLFSSEKSLSRAALGPFYAKGSTPDVDILKLVGMSLQHTKLDAATKEMVPLTKDELANFSAPTLVFYGEKDKLTNAEEAKERAQAIIPNLAAVEIIPNQGHFIGKEAQPQVNQKILTFLEGANEPSLRIRNSLMAG